MNDTLTCAGPDAEGGIDALVRRIEGELTPRYRAEFEARLRRELKSRDRDWLVDQVVRLALEAHGFRSEGGSGGDVAEIALSHGDAAAPGAAATASAEFAERERLARQHRLREMGLGPDALGAFLDLYRGHDRARLLREGYLRANAPEKGAAMLDGTWRTPAGDALLGHAKDVLYGLLFGDAQTVGARFDRSQREVLSLTLPRAKAGALDFLQAATELNALGTWRDPEGDADDARPQKVVLEVEYGEVEGELIGKGIVRALCLINCLEVNEQVLYARMVNVEQSTLIE